MRSTRAVNPDARFGYREGPDPMETVNFKVRGTTRPDIHDKIKRHMAALEVEEEHYRVKEIEYSPTIMFTDGRLPEDWTASVEVFIIPAVPF